MSRLSDVMGSRATRRSGRLLQLRGRPGRLLTGAAVIAAASSAALFSVMPVAGASSGPTYKYYSANVSPRAVLESTNPTPVTIILANETISNTSFGSAEITVPSSIVNGQAVTVPHGWTAGYLTTNPDVLLLTSAKSAAIAPGGTLPVTFSVTPSSSGSFTFGTEVKQSNNFSGTGNDFNYDSANSNLTFEVVTSATIAFDQQPTDVQQSNPTKSSLYYMCPPVSVQVSAPDGTPVGGVSVTVANNGPGDPGLYFNPASLSSPGATSGPDGVATFGADCSSGPASTGIAATNLGSGYTLLASATTPSGVVTSQPSSQFSVVQLLFTCTTNPCNSPTITGQSGTKGSISTTFGTPGYKILGSFGSNSLVCDGEVTTTPPDELDVQTTVGASGIVTMTFPKAVVNSLANNGTPLMQVCAGASAQFPGSTDQGPTVTPEWQGLVADCGTGYTAITDNVCVLSRSKKAASETIQIYVNDDSDPYFW